MEQFFELFLKNGLRPLSLFSESVNLEKQVNRSELSALLMLHFHGEMTMSELASDLGAPLSTITSLAKRLVRKGLVERNQSDKDQRVILIRLTEKGREFALQAREIMENILARVESVLSDEELQQFLTLAVKVAKALQDEEASKAVKSRTQQNSLRKIEIDD
ncbi:MarR family winged helix-turn-helix transcriptional regulator [Bacillus sp. 03113]|uniref:MarR family winged helix-turn-helix transcriptional regulator n=1 Tax=Bacillus sp. 03113 TaxID=2578211 RepID=UPI001143A9FA|nr:MarR family transcriptional regulator [Bacillus sp. 03113]